ncbi:cobalt ABC transporter permease [Pseudoroseicyclus sp. CXY001]|uniref:cobalt ABC transporter permease n=1 Tax=Pseudoroseicyclus sp. CXY001 TaxID=3242492 RepID=UPI00358DAB38
MRRLLAALLALAPVPALAHNLILEAYVVGDTIEGEAFFSDGLLVARTPIDVTGPDGAPLGEAVTDDFGAFRFRPSAGVDHLFRLDAGAGHVAEALIPAADLPAGLAGSAVAGAEAPAPDSEAAEAPANEAAPDDALVAAIDSAVTAELAPLRAQLESYRARADFLNILGAVGLLFGALGIGFFIAGARLARQARPSAEVAS